MTSTLGLDWITSIEAVVGSPNSFGEREANISDWCESLPRRSLIDSGGLLTNFATIRKSIKKMDSIDKMKTDGTFETLSKREKLLQQFL